MLSTAQLAELEELRQGWREDGGLNVPPRVSAGFLLGWVVGSGMLALFALQGTDWIPWLERTRDAIHSMALPPAPAAQEVLVLFGLWLAIPLIAVLLTLVLLDSRSHTLRTRHRHRHA